MVVSSPLAPHWASAKARVKGTAVSAVRARTVLDAVTMPESRTCPSHCPALRQNETGAHAAIAQRGRRWPLPSAVRAKQAPVAHAPTGHRLKKRVRLMCHCWLGLLSGWQPVQARAGWPRWPGGPGLRGGPARGRRDRGRGGSTSSPTAGRPRARRRVAAGRCRRAVLLLPARCGGALEGVHPLLAVGDPVADRSWLAVELRHGRGEEAAAGEDSSFDVGQEVVAECVQPARVLARGECRFDDFST